MPKSSARKSAATQAAYAAGYLPIFCLECKSEVHQLVTLVVRCPLGWKNFTKKGLRGGCIEIVEGRSEQVRLYCRCPAPKLPKHAKLLADRTASALEDFGTRIMDDPEQELTRGAQ